MGGALPPITYQSGFYRDILVIHANCGIGAAGCSSGISVNYASVVRIIAANGAAFLMHRGLL